MSNTKSNRLAATLKTAAIPLLIVTFAATMRFPGAFAKDLEHPGGTNSHEPVASVPAGEEWSQFRGPNGSGVSSTTGLPEEFGPAKNVVWKTALPPGHSSPVLTK